jgi:hypothetical protein
MFKHRKEEDNLQENIDSDDDVNDKNETIIDVVDYDEEIENEDVNENESVNMTFSNPSQPNKPTFKCEKCDLEAERKSDIMNHKKEHHNWCLLCVLTFSSQDKLKKHNTKNHKE